VLGWVQSQFGSNQELEQLRGILQTTETIGTVVNAVSLGAGIMFGAYKVTTFLVNKKTIGYIKSIARGAKNFIKGVDDIPRDFSSPYFVRIDLRFPGRPHPDWSIDTTTFHSGTKLAGGGVRNSRLFWKGWAAKRADTLSRENFDRAMRGEPPIIDDKWIRYFPEHSKFKNEPLVHHHEPMGGAFAIPVPNSTHVGSGGSWHGRLTDLML
jgi:hypothetical protein